jgi:hypothetical protein
MSRKLDSAGFTGIHHQGLYGGRTWVGPQAGLRGGRAKIMIGQFSQGTFGCTNSDDWEPFVASISRQICILIWQMSHLYTG